MTFSVINRLYAGDALEGRLSLAPAGWAGGGVPGDGQWSAEEVETSDTTEACEGDRDPTLRDPASG